MNGEVPTKRQFKLMILRIIETYGGNPVNKYNLLGSRPEEGGVSRGLNRPVTDEEKQLASCAWDELLTSGHLRIDLNQLMQTGHWCFMTDKGKYALQSGTLDSMDEALARLDPHLMTLRDGAHEALLSHTANANQQAANSGREFLNQTLRHLAPEDEIVSALWFTPDRQANHPSGINQGHRIRLAVEKSGVTDEEEQSLATSGLKLGGKRFVAGTHATSEPEREKLRDALEKTEMAFRILFNISV